MYTDFTVTATNRATGMKIRRTWRISRAQFAMYNMEQLLIRIGQPVDAYELICRPIIRKQVRV